MDCLFKNYYPNKIKNTIKIFFKEIKMNDK